MFQYFCIFQVGRAGVEGELILLGDRFPYPNTQTLCIPKGTIGRWVELILLGNRVPYPNTQTLCTPKGTIGF